ncbi:helix-turn-helix transcriptional regulator [uncultured Marixanthomonas sp.]|uniref:helix-turn-helix domain-containing protein n=1 Tax=uncultured Marixanthomonas sp. TaxID=757245 RepID=UPI0030DDC98C
MDIKSEVLKEIGGKIIEHRKRNKQTQEDISFFTGIEVSEISRYEKGKINLTISTLLKFSQALNIHPKELFNFDLNKHKIDL